jgi:hypothetical protein
MLQAETSFSPFDGERITYFHLRYYTEMRWTLLVSHLLEMSAASGGTGTASLLYAPG